MSEKEITVLFGSGADTDYCKSLPAGASFSKALLHNEYSDNLKKLLGNSFKQYHLIHHNSKKFFLQTIIENSKHAVPIFGETVFDICKNYENKDLSDNQQLVKKFCKCWYYLLKGNDKKATNYKDDNPHIKDFINNKEAIVDFFETYGVFFDTLDEKFNSLRFGTSLPSAKKVLNAYWTVYMLMLEKLYKLDENFEWSYSNLFSLLNKDYTLDVNKSHEDSYYDSIKKYDSKINIVTTNYTKLAEEKCCSNVTYLHGNMSWFEDVEKLTVYDCNNSTEMEEAIKRSDSLIPFILIPSGVKPMICKKQLVEFGKFISYLDNSSCLVVIGYKFNNEDNHINSIIGDWLKKSPSNKLVYFNFENSVDFNTMKWSENFHAQIKNIPINCNNARDEFSKYWNT